MSDLVKRLSVGEHRISAERYGSAEEFREAIEQGFVLLKFTETRGGTELGVRLNAAKSHVPSAVSASTSDVTHLVGTLVLDYNEVECVADIQVSERIGTGHLTILADEATWRAKKLQMNGTVN